MRIIETKVYQYNELSDDAKQKAREWFRESSIGDDYFTENVYDDAADMADIFGLDIRTRRTGTGNYKPNIYYSGFSSQGDGACFEGKYQYKAGALKAIKHAAGQDTELHRIVQALQTAQRRVFYKASASTKHRGHYYHSGCMTVDIELENDNSLLSEIEDDITQALRDFADWIYKQLEKEWEYQDSDEAVEENIIINEYEFTQEGKRV